MKAVRRITKYLIAIALVVSAAVLIIGYSYAGTNGSGHAVAPEPGTVALVSTGFAGWVITFVRRRYDEFKRIFDVAAASLGMVIASPVILVTAIFIKCVSPGPAFYKQVRVGHGGRHFNIYKLRTMRTDAERHSGPMWAQKNDPRLIKFGKVIRKLHLDELPQLVNVIRGDMSIVGPRPERPVFVEELSAEIADYKKRLEVKPGITGLAQVRNRYDETIRDVRKKVKLDLLYIREKCFMTDMRIMLRTVVVSALGKGAR